MSAAPPYPQGREILRGKTVLVTASAGTGIGYATATRCAEEGATVMLSDIHEKRLGDYADRLEQKIGRKVHRALCNVTDDAQVRALVDTAVREMGRLDVLVNNAGLGGTYDLVDTTDEQWLRIIDTNLTGTFRCLRAALPVMRAQGGGVIVNMGSICAWRAEAGQTAYAASKAGILALTRCAAIEAAPHNIRINAVVPSLALHPYLEKVSDPAHLQNLIRTNEAFGRAAEPWEIGNAIVFLASDYASYMTGEALSVSCRRA
ncbi:MAG TPA: SDR family oxidoreductase [Alphaproteobacteria bacterium]|jgi:3-oxoacyl-[acyl-carrier protein] reductase|nr:SDR family oxidoreductase [Alphaproteobacteria bacterium]